MAFIQCTKKLLAELPSTMETHPSKPTVLGNWHANLLRIKGRKCVLFTNDETLFSLFVPMLKKPHFQNLASVFLNNLIQTLRSEGFDEIIEQIENDYTDNLTYSKTNNRSVMGSMNDIARCLPFMLEREGGIESAEPLKINHNLNRMPLIKKRFSYAIEELQQKLLSPIQKVSPSFRLLPGKHISELQ